MKKIQFIKDGYEMIVAIPDRKENDPKLMEADAYYKDFDDYRILILADSEEMLVQLAAKELLTNHPFENVMKEY